MTVREPAPHPARWWHELPDPDGRIQCDLCPRYCRLREGQRAFCFVRARQADRMVLTTYGRSTGFCIDPIEKKPLNHFLPGTPVLSFGTAGCNLGCRFCQNWEMSKSREVDSLASIASPAAIAGTAREHGCASVAYTYNDPVLWAEYAIDTALACRGLGIQNVAVTAGFITGEARAEFFAAMDAANVDLKAFTDSFYKKACLSKPGGLADVLDTLVWLKHETEVWVEITTLLIPGLNDSDDEIQRECDWIYRELGPDVPVHFSAFHPDFRMTDRPHTLPATCRGARRIALDRGLRHVYTGNIHDPEGQTTFCPGCGTALIERYGYDIRSYRLDARSECPDCGTAIDGVFLDEAGDWGTRRLPVGIRAALGR
ncbi:MAG: AmmeMemoRadiSam system radical SAM enzyme [Planctomycetota bacterium]|jgi:pyruvate formate lyase activating enzyme